VRAARTTAARILWLRARPVCLIGEREVVGDDENWTSSRGPDRGNHTDGHGLGLSIVAAIATVHDATLNIQPRPDGGLHIRIEFPTVSTDHEHTPPGSEPAPARTITTPATAQR
jgi:hypothetical protein